nr:DUF4198 domain-containing protein [Cochlodiniinecator piscidefendens]
MRNILLAGAAALTLPTASLAHFQLAYTEESQIAQSGEVPMSLVFWHPFEAGHVMDMTQPLDFYAIHRGERIDLNGTLTETTFTSDSNTGVAFDASVPVRRSGDYVVVVEPAPYYEESEDIYIQQITKTYLNRNELPTDWSEPQGLVTEILPLNKPYNIAVGSTFTGQVLAEGQPVAGAEIEIEFMAATPNMETHAANEATASPLPGGAIVAISDSDGYFTFGIPRAGLWGFAALGSGPQTEFEGKELSQDAVIWIRAYDIE